MDKKAAVQINDIISKNTDNCVIITDNEGYTTWVNQGFSKLTGYSIEEIIGEKPGILLQGPSTDKKTKTLIGEAVKAEREFVGEILNYTKSKKPYWIELRIFPFENTEGELNFFGISKDITSKVLRKSPETESENIHKLLLENSNEVISLHEADSSIIYISPSCKNVMGYSQEELIGNTLNEHIRGEDYLRMRAEVENFLSKGKKPPIQTFQFTRKDGKVIWLETSIGLIKDEHGNTQKAQLLSRDVTEKINLTQLLKDTSRLAHVGGWHLNTKTGRVNVTEGIRKILGIKNPEEEGINTFRYFHKDDKKLVESKFNDLLETGKGYDLELQLTDEQGIEKWVRAIARAEKNNNEVVKVYGVMQDITSEKRMAERLSITGEVAKVGGWEINALTGESFLTDHVYDIYGLPKGTPVSAEKGISFYHPEDLPIITEAYSKLVEEGIPYDIEVRFIDAKGKHKWVRAMGRCEKVDGKVIRTYGSFQDITEMKKYQERLEELNKKLEDKVKERTIDLEQSNQELRTFNYMISHDLRTPLRAISIFANQLKSKLRNKIDDESITEEIDLINDGVNEMNRLITDLLEFAKLRNNKLRLETTDIKPLINYYFKESKTLCSDVNAKIKIDELPILEIDKTLFAHVLSNIIGNAFKYSKEKDLNIYIQYEKENQHHLLKFKDDGVGFNSESAKDVFKPFKRLVAYNHSQGSGLGLSICERIIQQHNGEIWAESEEGKGAQFCIKLPVNERVN